VLAVMLLLTLVHTATAQDKPTFQTWLGEYTSFAATQGIQEEVLRHAFKGVDVLDTVIAFDRRQPEKKFTLPDYLMRVVTARRIADGRQRYQDHRSLLEKVSKQYGVPAPYLVALWGVETDYGRITGGYPVIPALATLAYDGRREEFFRKELLEALRILQEKHIPLDRFYGSWAGAMGQCQFMPSSFRAYAVDGDGDGKKDIWQNVNDVFPSIANYLKTHGWKTGEGWGQEVQLPATFAATDSSPTVLKPASTWQKMGVVGMPDKALPAAWNTWNETSIVLPDGMGGKSYLVGENFRTVLKWNRSFFFAVAVGTLADAIAAPVSDEN
jgi:membrane-bound lytic murein transglycosylase B